MNRLKWLHLTPVIAAITSFSVAAAAQDAPAQPAGTQPGAAPTESTQSQPPEVPPQAAPPPSPAPATTPAPPAEDEKPLPPGSFKVPGTKTVLTLSGYAQLDLTYDAKGRDPQVEDNDWAIHAAALPLDKTYEVEKKSGQLYLTARTSRVGISTATPTDFADIGTKVEGDFNIGNLLSGQTFTNSVLFRLRHAYGTLTGKLGTLLIGQSWSTFLDMASYADTVDFNGPGSIPLIRQPQVRYTIPLVPGTLNLSLAAENSPGTDRNGITDPAGPTRRMQTVPDGIIKLAASGDWGSVALGGMTTQYKFSGRTMNDDAYLKQGWGANLGVVVNIPGIGDKIRAYGVGGRGVGRYLFNAGVGGQMATDIAQDNIALHDAAAYHVGYTRKWSSEVRSNVVWSQTFLKNPRDMLSTAFVAPSGDDPGGIVAGGNKRIDQLFINTFWSPAKQVAFGIEYAFSQRNTFGDDNAPEACNVPGACASQKGTMHRVTTSAHFDFF